MDQVPECQPEAFLVPKPDITWSMGRVRVELDEVDGVVGAGRINKESVMLESTEGQLVKLNLNRIFEEKKPLFLAPGSIIVVEGVNTNGRCLDIHAVHDCTEMSSTTVKKEKAELRGY